MAYALDGNAVWYTDGVVSVTQGSYTVIGAGTLFTSQVAAGDCFAVLSDGGVVKMYQVQSVTDNTHLTLVKPYAETTAAGIEYAVVRNFSGTWSIPTELASQLSTLRRAWAEALATQFKGDSAPNMVLQFSADATTWHASPASGDLYIRFSVDDSVTWSAAARFKGEAGTNAPAAQIQYSADGSSWHALFTTGDAYFRFSVDGGGTWGSAVYFKGAAGTPASELQIQYSADGSSWHATATSGDIYIRFSTDGGTSWGNAFYVAVVAASESTPGTVEKATDSEFDAGSDAARYASIAQIRKRISLGYKNLLINGAFFVNQRAYVSAAATTGANQYTLDRWRVVTSGEALSWTDSNGTRTVTAPAGGIEQVVEGTWLQSGTYTISWTGTATCTVGGTARTNGEAFSLTGGSNVTVKFINGTVANAQLELGGCATPFERRPDALELSLCQRYCYRIALGTNKALAFGYVVSTGYMGFYLYLPVQMRTTPTATLTTLTTYKLPTTAASDIELSTIQYASNAVYCYCSGTFSGYSAEQLLIVTARAAGGAVLFDAEL